MSYRKNEARTFMHIPSNLLVQGVLVHSAVMTAWLEGKDVQALELDGTWVDSSAPLFLSEIEYRVKPKLFSISVELEVEVFYDDIEADNAEAAREIARDRVRDKLDYDDSINSYNILNSF